ncbi:MAG: chemotaxis protein CheC [Gemmataceae bacterium]
MPSENELNPSQLQLLETSFHQGAAEASEAFSKWTGKPSTIRVESVEQLPLADATGVLGLGGEPICFVAMEMKGRLTGQLLFGFEEASGLALADLLLGQALGESQEWGELETSAALETTNILGCAFLNSLARVLPWAPEGPTELIPSPPIFARDFPDSLIQFALMGQAMVSDHVLLARTEFHINETPVDWNLLFVPDAESMSELRSMLPRNNPH